MKKYLFIFIFSFFLSSCSFRSNTVDNSLSFDDFQSAKEYVFDQLNRGDLYLYYGEDELFDYVRSNYAPYDVYDLSRYGYLTQEEAWDFVMRELEEEQQAYREQEAYWQQHG